MFEFTSHTYSVMNVSIFDIGENENQKRRYVWHTYTTSLDEYIYEITGKSRNFENWKMIGHKHYNNRFIMD